jgi:hypothetical protein
MLDYREADSQIHRNRLPFPCTYPCLVIWTAGTAPDTMAIFINDHLPLAVRGPALETRPGKRTLKISLTFQLALGSQAVPSEGRV